MRLREKDIIVVVIVTIIYTSARVCGSPENGRSLFFFSSPSLLLPL